MSKENLTISKTRAVKIFEAIGFRTANKWDEAHLQKRLVKLEVLVEGTELDEKTQKRVNEVLQAQKEGITVIVIDVEKVESGKQLECDIKAAKKRDVERKVDKRKQTEKKEKNMTEKKKQKTKASKKQKQRIVEKTKKNPGVIMSVLEFVKNQGPISDKEILALLKKRFPDRNPETMERTIPQIPGYLSRKKGINNIKTDDKGRYIFKK